MAEKLGLKEVVAMGVGGVVGGGIFAVLGVAAQRAGNAAFLTYLLAGIIALASSYSYVRMTRHLDEAGGSFTFLEHYVDHQSIAAMVAWVLVAGYVGTMAMYAYAFGSFTVGLLGVGADTLLRRLVSIGIIAVFIGVNILGVRESGESEDIMVYAKITILLLFSVLGLYAILTRPEFTLFAGGMFDQGVIAPIMAVGAIFVSFEGWQLLTYEYGDIAGGGETLERGVFITVIASTLIYIFVALATTGLVSPETIVTHKETVLAFAAQKVFAAPLLRQISVVLVSLAAILSTASAINATLFGTARFTHKVATEDALPRLFSFQNREGIPVASLAVTGILTALFTALGSLEEITTFASIAFIGVFSVVNYVCLRDPDVDVIDAIPVFGLIGAGAVLLLEGWHLYVEQPHMLAFIAGVFVVLAILELVYIDRDEIEAHVAVMHRIDAALGRVEERWGRVLGSRNE